MSQPIRLSEHSDLNVNSNRTQRGENLGKTVDNEASRTFAAYTAINRRRRQRVQLRDRHITARARRARRGRYPRPLRRHDCETNHGRPQPLATMMMRPRTCTARDQTAPPCEAY